MRMPITFVVIALMLLLSFRNLQGMLIPMLTAALSTVWGLGLMGHTGSGDRHLERRDADPADRHRGRALGADAQALHRGGRAPRRQPRRGDRAPCAMGPVMLAAGGVAAIGFASLALTGIPAITGFGLSCSYGIASAVVLEMTFIPALRAVLPAAARACASRAGRRVLAAPLERGILTQGGRPVLIATASRGRARGRRRAPGPHLRIDARVHGARQPAPPPPRGDREALPRARSR